MSGGSDTMAPLNAVLETFGREVSVLTEKVSALEKDASSKTGVIDKQKGEISSLKAEVDERVQQIDSLKGEISGVKKTMDERAQQITDLQKQLSASLKENETLLEENKTLQTIGSPEQRKDDAGAAGSKRDGPAASEDGQPSSEPSRSPSSVLNASESQPMMLSHANANQDRAIRPPEQDSNPRKAVAVPRSGSVHK